MRKVSCVPISMLPEHLDETVKYFIMYSHSQNEKVGCFGNNLLKEIESTRLLPNFEVLDFLSIALSISSADMSISRKESPDGWTREINIEIALHQPEKWLTVKKELENTFKFLTGDIWYISFISNKINITQQALSIDYNEIYPTANVDCVSLLSGGLDSLVGAIDLVAERRNPLFISHSVRGNNDEQRHFAKKISKQNNHLQWNSNIRCPKGEKEPSTRARSIVFFAFAAIGASFLKPADNRRIQIFVPENGFISLNPPLSILRTGSYSTKTTHPIYLGGIQDIWNKIGLNFELVSPYQHKTKGEIMLGCKNQQLIKELASQSTSCGKYSRNKSTHCGRCVPCLVRIAAFRKAGIEDGTHYSHKLQDKIKPPNDISAMRMACDNVKRYGIESITGGCLTFANSLDKKVYERTLLHGINEISEIL